LFKSAATYAARACTQAQVPKKYTRGVFVNCARAVPHDPPPPPLPLHDFGAGINTRIHPSEKNSPRVIQGGANFPRICPIGAGVKKGRLGLNLETLNPQSLCLWIFRRGGIVGKSKICRTKKIASNWHR
jgi:hypothetical protein